MSEDKREQKTEQKPPLHPLKREIKGYLPPAFRIQITNILSMGHVQELIDTWKARRAKIGLTETPPTAYKYPDAVDAIQKIVHDKKIDDLIGYDPKQKKLKY
jgi:heterodisulfide reductase subunit C